MGRKIAGLEEDVLLTGGLVLGGYMIFKSLVPDLIPSIGVTNDNKLTLDQQQALDPNISGTANIFSSLYPSANAFALANIDFSHYENSTDFYNAIYGQYIHGQLPPSNPFYTTIQLYDNLNGALIGHLVSGNQADILAALNAITNKYQVGIITEMFQDINSNTDFWHLLRYGWGTCIYGLNGNDLADQVNRLNSLPE